MTVVSSKVFGYARQMKGIDGWFEANYVLLESIPLSKGHDGNFLGSFSNRYS